MANIRLLCLFVPMVISFFFLFFLNRRRSRRNGDDDDDDNNRRRKIACWWCGIKCSTIRSYSGNSKTINNLFNNIDWTFEFLCSSLSKMSNGLLYLYTKLFVTFFILNFNRCWYHHITIFSFFSTMMAIKNPMIISVCQKKGEDIWH